VFLFYNGSYWACTIQHFKVSLKLLALVECHGAVVTRRQDICQPTTGQRRQLVDRANIRQLVPDNWSTMTTRRQGSPSLAGGGGKAFPPSSRFAVG
jgi:hypothetical protein